MRTEQDKARAALRIVLAAAFVIALIVAFAPTAFAHDFGGDGDCEGWTLELDGTYGAHTILIDGVAQDQVATEYSIPDTNLNREQRSFTVKWDKDSGDVTKVHELTRDTSDCIGFTYEAACGVVDITFWNESAFVYSVALEEGTATYDLGNAQFSTSQFTWPEDYNGGSVDVFLYLVGAEADYVAGHYPNYWEQNAAEVTVDTDCEPEPTTTTTAPTTTTTEQETTTTEQETTTTTEAETTTTEQETTTTPAVDPTTTTAPETEDTLPFTGADDPLVWGAAALALLATGGLTLAATRREE